MSALEQAARRALAVLESEQLWPVPHAANEAIDALRAALAQQQVEPVACGHESCDCRGYCKREQAEPVALDAKVVHFARTALHEMPRPATDWHHCAKRVCEAVVALSQQAEPVADAVLAEPVSALQRYRELETDPEIYTGTALERLRIFCSLAMGGMDWLDAESFFDDAEQELANKQAEPVISKDAYDRAREDLAIWKIRALKAEELNRKFVASVNSQTYMGEPVQAEPVAYCYVRKNSSADALTFDPNPVNAVEGTVFPLYAHPPQQAEPMKGESK